MTETEKKTTTETTRTGGDAVELRRQYYREYRARNKDKVREWNAAYWQRKAQKAAKNNDHAV